MIFRTINADAKKLTEQFGLLNKSFRDIKKDFANGLGFKNSLFQTSISKIDYQALQKFNSAIKVTNDGLTKSQRITKAWNENMSGCSIAAKRMGNDLVTGKKNIQDISKAMKRASGSTKALGVAMNVMANVGFMLAITAITKVISELAQAQDNAIQAAKEATETYKSELDSINDYKQRLSELHEELKSGNLSYEETKTKRTELMTIQDELIEKFGNEKGAIESVTEAVNGQIDALDNLNEKAYRDWVAKADEQTFWNKLLPGGKSGLDQAIDYMETKKTVSFMDMQNANLSDELQAIQKEIDETIQAKYNLDKTFAMFNVTGTPDELRTQLENILQDYADISKEIFTSKGIDWNLWEEYRKETTDSINEAINSLDKGLEKHQDTYKTYIEGLIKYDSEYSDEYANILQKRAELKSAQNSGNAEEVKKAKQEFMDSINDAIIASDSDESIKKYFESLYPELQAEFDNWAFEFDLEVNKDGIADVAKEIGEKYTATDLLGMVNDGTAFNVNSPLNSLIDAAVKYKICTNESADEVQKLIDLLVELGIVQGEYKEAPLSEPTTFSSVLNNSADSLDAFQSSVKSAADAYATLLSGNYSSTDLLNSIQAINKAATDMGKSIRWEEIDSLDALGDQIEEISQAYADSVLSDAGLSKDSKFGQMLTDIIRASYQSEAALSSLNTQIDSLQDSYRNLNDIVDTYNEHGHITFDQLQTLLDMEPRYLSCLVSEDGQLRLNQDAMQELAAMRLADARAQIIQQAVTELGELAQKRETKTVEDNTMALTDNMETLTTYERRIIDLLPGLALTGNEFCRISNAINGAMQDGASDEDIDEVLRNAAKKAKFITGMADGNIDDMFGGFSSAAVSATEELNSYLDAQEKALDAGKISFREYCDSISSHIRKAYDNGKISAKEFWDYQGQFLEKQKSSYDKVISAVTRKLDGEIDTLRDRQDEIDGFYESQISSLEETRKLLQENNDERKRQADLQKALYEMERAHNQRTVLQYSEGMGMHYVSDPNAVRDAENSIADARLNIRTAEIDSAISRLERQRDSEKSAIDEIIRNLEAYKAKWSEVSSAFEEAQEDQLAAEILGQEWEADVLGMRIDTLSAFAENYVNLQRTIADAAWESAKAQAEAQKLINEQTSDAPGNRSAAIKKVADYGAGIANALRDKFDLSKHPLKFHTGLKQGLVDTPSLNRDFKLVQDVGLGRNEVPAVLKKGEIVATQEQVSNLAAGLRQTGSQTILVNGMELRALQPGDKTYDLMQKWDTYFGRIDGNVEKLLPGSFFEQREQVTASANHIVSNNVESHNRDIQPTIHNEIHVTLPNVTNATSAETLLKDLQSLGTKKLQVNW